MLSTVVSKLMDNSRKKGEKVLQWLTFDILRAACKWRLWILSKRQEDRYYCCTNIDNDGDVCDEKNCPLRKKALE